MKDYAAYYDYNKKPHEVELSPSYDNAEFCSICEMYNKSASIMVSTFHHPSECPFWKPKIESRIINGEKPLDRALREVTEKYPLKG